jgi:hypothetical protein
MNARQSGNGNRKGQFLWMDPPARNNYLQNLKAKISEDYFFSESVLSKIVDDLAPIIDEVTFFN